MAVDIPARIAFLKKIHIFSGLEEDDFAALAEELEEVNIPKDEVIFKQDGPADSFYMIYGGSVRIVRRQDGKDFQLALLVRNDYFGEIALVSNRRRSATVTALQDTSLLVLSRADFQKLFKDHPEIKNNLEVAVRSRQLAGRLRFKWLTQNEVVYFLARKHPIVLYQKLFVPVLVLLIPSGFLYAWLSIVRSFVVILAGGLSLLAVAGWIAWLVIDWGNDYYIVTNQRVVWLEKVVGLYDSRQESPLSTVQTVGVETDQLGRILDYGNVIVRTYVGRIPFNHVIHPYQAQKMIEEHQKRTQERAGELEKEAMKDVLRRKLNLPPKSAGTSQTQQEPNSVMVNTSQGRGRVNLLRFLGANTLKLRYETGESVVYRKHWMVLVEQTWIPLLGTLGVLILFLYRLFQLAFLPEEAFISLRTGVAVDAWAGAAFIALFPLIAWLLYEVVDWSNDKFEVTPDQIIDIDRKPFRVESRNAAQLENILSTNYERLGILSNLFNYGTVYITVGGSKLAFEDVMDPAAVQSDIDRRRMARQQKKTETVVAAERERMAEWLVTYHNNAEEFRKAEEEKNRNQKSGSA